MGRLLTTVGLVAGLTGCAVPQSTSRSGPDAGAQQVATASANASAPDGPRMGGPPDGGPAFGPPGRRARPHMVAALDANGDDIVDAQELAGAGAALAKLDNNGDGRLTPDEMRPRLSRRSRWWERATFDRELLGKDDAERKALGMLAVMHQQGREMRSVPPDDGRLLRVLVESIGARNVVEIGTSQGYSAIFMALALRKTGGKLTTFEIDPRRAALAKRNFERAGVADLITVVLGDAHEKIKQLTGPIDLLFLDADKDGYIDYLKQLVEKVRAGGLIVAHNMNERQADLRYVRAITTNADLETAFLNRGAMGLGVTLKKR